MLTFSFWEPKSVLYNKFHAISNPKTPRRGKQKNIADSERIGIMCIRSNNGY